MAKYIDKLPKYKEETLLKEFKIKPDEDVVASTEISAYGGKLYVVHGKNSTGERIESIFTDFTIIKIYSSTPSEYDIDKFQNVMEYLCGPQYAKDAKAFNNNFRKQHNSEFIEGNFDSEEYQDK